MEIHIMLLAEFAIVFGYFCPEDVFPKERSARVAIEGLLAVSVKVGAPVTWNQMQRKEASPEQLQSKTSSL